MYKLVEELRVEDTSIWGKRLIKNLSSTFTRVVKRQKLSSAIMENLNRLLVNGSS